VWKKRRETQGLCRRSVYHSVCVPFFPYVKPAHRPSDCVVVCSYLAQPYPHTLRTITAVGVLYKAAVGASTRATKRKTSVLRPVADLAQDQVHSAACLSIGQGNLFRGQENKEMFFPKTIKFFPTPTHVPVVKEGWACKGVTGVKGGAFKRSQRDFLLSLFNNNGGPKIRERDARIKMSATFKDKDEDSDYSLRLVLIESQIKTWFSSEVGRRKKTAVNRLFEKGFTEFSQSIDLQDNQEGGHDQNGGVVEEGDPPPPVPSPPPPPPSPPLPRTLWFCDKLNVSEFLKFLD
jgi:hypothetical protein